MANQNTLEIQKVLNCEIIFQEMKGLIEAFVLIIFNLESSLHIMNEIAVN